MKRIWKYPLKVVGGIQYISLPLDSSVKYVGSQNNSLYLWVEFDKFYDIDAARRFVVIGTGMDIQLDAVYHGTVQMGLFVWHVYELI